jgi:hypothetical protein
METSAESGARTSFILGATTILCSYCRDILDSWELILGDSNRAFPHHQSIAELENAAVSECSMCYQFLRSRWLESQSSLITTLSTEVSVYVLAWMRDVECPH